MILACLALLAAAPSGGEAVKEASLALSRGRPVQAREMIRAAVASGASGRAVDRLLADLAFAEQRWPEAAAGYDALVAAGVRDARVFEAMAIAALAQSKDAEAAAHAGRAMRLPGAGWRAYNVRAVVADRARDWAAADAAYAKGLELDADAAELRNNLGWSLLLRGRWEEAHHHLAHAAALAPGNRRILANRDLAASALTADLPQRRAGESGSAYAMRLNDAGALALRAGQPGKARAAFAQALEQSDRWFQRAANNLELASAEAPSAHR